MSEGQRVVLVDAPEIAERGATLFPGSLVVYANGQLPPEAMQCADVVVVSSDAERIAALCGARSKAGPGRIRAWHLDISTFTERKQVTANLDSLREWAPESESGPTANAAPPDHADIPETAKTAQNAPTPGLDDSAPPPWHSEIPEGAETTVKPFVRRKRTKLSLVEGNTARWPEADAEPMPAALSEDCLAAHFVDNYGDNWRYVTEWGVWLKWEGDGWHEDKRNQVSNMFRRVTREALEWRDAQTLTPDGRRRLNSKRTAWNARDMAAADSRISIESAELDADPFLLGVPGGVVDLKIGKLIEATPEQYITRRTAVPPEPGPHPLFDRVLARACGGHDGMREYLLRWFGYFLTGDVREEAFIFLHGPGGSGKSTLIKAITEIMGDYAVAISMDAFVEQKNPRHSQEIAKLAGKRLVFASETDEGRRWNEALVKSLTGRDKISAHKMRMDDFEFDPTFKLLLFGNSIPSLKSVGEEIKRRIHLIEYAGSLSETERDNTLKDRLKGEYPAILHTLIQFCVDWQDVGLGKPESVSVSVDEYLEGEDSLAMFLGDCVEIDRSARESSGDVYRRYQKWAAGQGEYVMSQKRLVSALKQRGYTPMRSGGARLISGLRLKHAEPEYPPPGYQQD